MPLCHSIPLPWSHPIWRPALENRWWGTPFSNHRPPRSGYRLRPDANRRVDGSTRVLLERDCKLKIGLPRDRNEKISACLRWTWQSHLVRHAAVGSYLSTSSRCAWGLWDDGMWDGYCILSALRYIIYPGSYWYYELVLLSRLFALNKYIDHCIYCNSTSSYTRKCFDMYYYSKLSSTRGVCEKQHMHITS